MKLTKYQKARLQEYEWTPIETEVNGEIQNCSWISIAPEDGTIFQECLDVFHLVGDGEDIKLLVVATREGEENE
jgi:hypothetical protein